MILIFFESIVFFAGMIFSNCCAEEIDDYEIIAQYEASEYDNARALYELLLEQTSDPVKKQYILYNIGSIFLAEDDSQTALEYFNTIELGDEASPLLIRRLKFNTALAVSQTIQEEVKALNEKDWAYKEKIEYGILQLKQALYYLSQAEQADCQIEMLLKKTTCETANDIQLLKHQIHNQLDDLQKLLDQYRPISTTQFDTPPIAILKKILNDQKEAYREVNIALATLENSQIRPQNDLVDLQQKVLEEQQEFFQTIILWEKSQFNDKLECQKEPWDTVLALYNSGYQAASLAKIDLSREKSYWTLALKQQVFAMKQWQKALEVMEKYQSKPHDEKTVQNKLETTSSNFENTIKLIEEMQNADQTPLNIPSESVKKGDAPW